MVSKTDAPISVDSVIRVVTYLTAGIGLSAVIPHITPVVPAVFGVLAAVAAYRDYRAVFVAPRWAINMASVCVIVIAVFRFRSEDLVTSTLEALLLLSALKLLEEKRFRDHMQIYLMSVLLLAGTSLLSLDLVFIAYYLLLLFLVAFAAVLLTYESQVAGLRLERPVFQKIALRSLLLPLAALPLTALLFLVLPRASFPLLGFLGKASQAKSGFTDSISLGSISSIQEDGSVSFRAAMPRVHDASLYWRGVVFDDFDGAVWKPSRSAAEVVGRRPPEGTRVQQTVYLEPHGNRYLFALDLPLTVSITTAPFRGAREGPARTFFRDRPIDRRIKYEAVSVIGRTGPERLTDPAPYLQVPDSVSRDLKDLVNGLAAGRRDDEKVAAVLRHLGQGAFRYSLEDLPVSQEPVSEFLLRSRYGNCEYFASAMAVMLRISGVPSRLVGGYRGGYYNEMGGYYAVLQKNAHVWVEAYLQGRGWVRFDPTPAAPGLFSDGSSRGPIARARLILDMVSYAWNAMIVNYDFRKQTTLLTRVHEGLRRAARPPKVDWRTMLVYGSIGLATACLALALRNALAARRSRETRIIEGFVRKLRRLGYERKASEGLEEFAARIAEPDLRTRAQTFVSEFEGAYYRDRPLGREEKRRLRGLLKTL